jgi:hypothetical protein
MAGAGWHLMEFKEEILVMEPLPCFSIYGKAYLQARNILFRLTAIVLSQISSAVSTTPP